MIFCKKCGVQLPDGAQFCKNCGEPVGMTRRSNVEERKSSSFGEKVKEGAKLSVKNLLYVALPTILVTLGIGAYGVITGEEGGGESDDSKEVEYRPNQLPREEENVPPEIPASSNDVVENTSNQPAADNLGDLEGIEGLVDVSDEEADEIMRGIEERDKERLASTYLGTWKSEVGCVVPHSKVAGLSNDQIVNFINSNAAASNFTELIFNKTELAVKSKGKVTISGTYRILEKGSIEVSTKSGSKGEFWAYPTSQDVLYFMMDYVEDDGTPTSVCLRMKHQ